MKESAHMGPLETLPRHADTTASAQAAQPSGLKDLQQTEKRTFVLLLLVACVVMVGMAFFLWWVPYVGLSNIHPRLPLILAIAFGCVVLFWFGGALTLVMTIIRGKNLFFNRRIRGVVIRFLFPLLVIVGKCLGISKARTRKSFIAINNQLVLAEAKQVDPDRLLLLLPHCLQNHECRVRIIGNVYNCEGCGKCKIRDLVALSKKFDVPVSVATGGTLARKIVVERRPDIIIAVACERDLTSGIQDSYPIPVFGIFNRRPFGPCYDTDVDLDLVETGIVTFLRDPQKAARSAAPREVRAGSA